MDLASAVERQTSFAQKIVNLGWGASNNTSALVLSVARYHAFLDLMAARPGEFFVPTLVRTLSIN